MNKSTIPLTLMGLALMTTLGSCSKGTDKQTAATTTVTIDTALTADEATKGILTPEIMWKFGRVESPVLSPDGKQLAYTVTYYNLKQDKGVTDLYKVSTDGGQPIKLTDEQGSESNPQWSADGKTIYFLSTRGGSQQLWSISSEGTNLAQLSHGDTDINGFRISPSGAKILYAQDVKVEKTKDDIYPDMPNAKVRIYDHLMYRHWNIWEDGSYSHVFVADFANGIVGEPKDINKDEMWDTPIAPDFDIAEVQWSPNSKQVVYVSKKLTGKDYAISTNSDIYLYNVETGETKNLTPTFPGYDRSPVFSPDGKYLAWWSMATPGYESDQKRLFVMDMATGASDYLSKDFDQDVEQFSWDANNKDLFFVSGIKATEQLYKINIDTKLITQLTKGMHDYTLCQMQGGVLIGEKMSMSMAPELFRVDPTTGAEKQLTFTNEHIYQHIKMGKSIERWIKTTDGKEMLTWVILPPNFDSTKVYPALLYCQGGPQSTVSQFWSFRWNFQIMAANNYVIVAPNRRGLPSFGQAWNAQISGDYSGQNIKDYLSAIDDVKKEPWVDANRLGCVGASYGGYSVYYLAGVHQKRFKVFIAHCGMYNLESFYAETEETWFPNHDFGGPYWDKNNKVAQRTYANSPHKLVDKWDTPIMIIEGENDFRIPYTEGLQAFNAAQLRGIPSKLLVFPNETHFVSKPQDSVIWQREFFAWLDKYLKK